ncbi:Rho protein [Polychaeton citri CBS 116435]|uniref:Rho protein n=1 Tax=Polychaeton citri CBS 116435 TaxID=1314669 RepID=A0A9P4Q364_9PEZI|nr:Rho protein [Polychaeton citri CBS 116435]
MVDPFQDAPEVPILILGDAGIGKSTLLSRFSLGSQGGSASSGTNLPNLRDLDQPFAFNIRMYNRPYRFEFYDTASPQHYTLLKPALLVLCYSIADPKTLRSIHEHWKFVVEENFNADEQIPIIMLGLQRDVRSESDYDGRVRRTAAHDDGDSHVLNPRKFVYPQEGLRVAQEMRLDRYCECSAITGELCLEVFEDIARTAAMTTTAKGGKSDGTYCSLM